MLCRGGGPATSEVTGSGSRGPPQAAAPREACHVAAFSAHPSSAVQSPALSTTSEPASENLRSHGAGLSTSSSTIAMHKSGADHALARAQQSRGLAERLEGPSTSPSLRDEPFDSVLSPPEEAAGERWPGAHIAHMLPAWTQRVGPGMRRHPERLRTCRRGGLAGLHRTIAGVHGGHCSGRPGTPPQSAAPAGPAGASVLKPNRGVQAALLPPPPPSTLCCYSACVKK